MRKPDKNKMRILHDLINARGELERRSSKPFPEIMLESIGLVANPEGIPISKISNETKLRGANAMNKKLADQENRRKEGKGEKTKSSTRGKKA